MISAKYVNQLSVLRKIKWPTVVNGMTLQIVVLVFFSAMFVISYNMVKKIKAKIALQ